MPRPLTPAIRLTVAPESGVEATFGNRNDALNCVGHLAIVRGESLNRFFVVAVRLAVEFFGAVRVLVSHLLQVRENVAIVFEQSLFLRDDTKCLLLSCGLISTHDVVFLKSVDFVPLRELQHPQSG